MSTPAHYDSIFRPGLFKDQVHIVTGGGSGIGRCTAHELAALGATVVITGRNEEKLARTAAEITEDGGKVFTAAFDIRDEDQVKAAVAAIVEKHGLVQITDTGAIEAAVDALIAANPDKAEAVKEKPQAIGWFVGQVMKETGGKANPAAVNEILKAKLGL